jgi:hypothetical protein
MKKIIVLLLVLLLLAGCTPPPYEETLQTSVAVQIPEALVLALSGFFVTMFAIATVWLFEHFRLDLRNVSVPVGIAFGAWIVSEAQNYINTIPTTYDPWLILLFRILVVIAVPVGTLRLLSKKRASLLPE